jgi:hypothetical protein
MDNLGEFYRKYLHYIDRPWVPPRESHDNTHMNTIIKACKNTMKSSNLVNVHSI